MSDFIKCKSCGAAMDHPVTLLTHGPHYARMDCGGCGRFLRFMPKPEGDKAKRPAAHRALVDKSGLDWCELCLVKRDCLPAGETLEAHHIEEYRDGGGFNDENLLIVCTSCHRLISWRRTEMRHHVGIEGQHHAEREAVPEVPDESPPMGELETDPPWGETDEGPTAA